MSEPITVVIADDHPLFRKGLRALLATVPEVDVVGEATSGADAVRITEELRPHLVLMDLQMPGGSGLDAIRRLAVTRPESRILVVTMFEDDDSVVAALRAGARGYTLEDADDTEMLRAFLAVAHGEGVFSAAVASRMLSLLGDRPSEVTRPFPHLTESERSVLGPMARGLTNDSIALQLRLSPKTVRNYVSAAFAKLHVASRGEAIARTHEAGLP